MDTPTGGAGAELVAVLSAATELLLQLPVSVSRLGAQDLDAVLRAVDRLAAVATAGRFTLASEADGRGDVAASSAGSVRVWVGERCPSLEAREVGTLTRAVRELHVPALEAARAAVVAGRMSVGAGVVVASELEQLRPLLHDGAEGPVLAGLVEVGVSHGCAGVRSLRPAMLARYGLGAVIQAEQDRRAGLTRLSCGHDIGGGMTEYRMRLAPESRAVVEAAINALSRPARVGAWSDPGGGDVEHGPVAGDMGFADAVGGSPDGASGRVDAWHRDSRTVEQRRGEALVEVGRRFGTLAAAHAKAADVADPAAGEPLTPAGVRATVLVTMSMDDLRSLRRPGTVIGGLDAGTVLGPETVRKLTCDGALVPAVLGTEGEVLHLGRTRRLFSPAQIRALWLRDRHCSYPGCTVPATWTDAHHLRHWADGGPTDLTNAVLLCGRHHTLVHRDRLTASRTPTGLQWDRVPGSYDRAPPGEADVA